MEYCKNIAFLLLLTLGSCFLHAQQNTIGTIAINKDKVAEGYTLFAPVSSTSTYLVDNCGNTINQWESDRTPGLSVYLQENGNLIRTCRKNNTNFSAGGVAGGIEIFDWEGNELWGFFLSNEQNVLHHDIELLPNGNILAIVYELVTKEEALNLGRQLNLIPDRGLWIDKIIEIKPVPNGSEIVWEWSSIDHVVQEVDANLANFGQLSLNPGKLDINFFRDGFSPGSDWMHTNAIDYNEELDQIIISSKHFHEFFIIDHSTSTSEASGSTGGRYGKGGDFLYRWGNPQNYGLGTEADRQLFDQHDAHWIEPGNKDEGKIFVFNNGTNRPGGSISTVDIIDLPLQENGTYFREAGLPFGPLEAEFVYGNNPNDENFTASRMSGVQQLPNDNVLIASGPNGVLIEIDDQQNVVWEYVIPTVIDDVGTQGSIPFGNAVFRANKYPLDFPAFQNNNIVVGDPIELNPNNEFCNGPVSTFSVALEPAPFEIVNTIVYGQMRIRADQETEIEIIDVTGRIFYSLHIQVGDQLLDMGDLNDGMYYIKNGNPKYSNFVAVPFIKMK